MTLSLSIVEWAELWELEHDNSVLILFFFAFMFVFFLTKKFSWAVINCKNTDSSGGSIKNTHLNLSSNIQLYNNIIALPCVSIWNGNQTE